MSVQGVNCIYSNTVYNLCQKNDKNVKYENSKKVIFFSFCMVYSESKYVSYEGRTES